MFGKLGDMMGNLQEAKRKIDETKANLDNILINESSSNGKIDIQLTASRTIKDIKIDPSLLEDAEELGDHLILTLNKAIQKADKVNEEQMKGAASGMMDMPGMDQFFK